MGSASHEGWASSKAINGSSNTEGENDRNGTVTPIYQQVLLVLLGLVSWDCFEKRPCMLVYDML
jgi:hypothetical protein